MDLVIDPTFEAFFPSIDNSELEALIKEEGCRDPIVIWAGKNIIVDGRRRYRICKKLGIKFRTRELEFVDRDAVFAWMSKNQLARLNLTDSQRRYYDGKQYLCERKTQGGPDNVMEGGTSERAAERGAKGPAAAEGNEEPIRKPPEVYDGTGSNVTDKRYVEVFSDREAFVKAIKTAKSLRASINRMAPTPGGATMHIEETEAWLNCLVQELECHMPRCICTRCKGGKIDPVDARQECSTCGGLGWIDEFTYTLTLRKCT